MSRALNRETKSRFNLTVRAMNIGQRSAYSDVVVLVHILDANDNAPVFEKQVRIFNSFIGTSSILIKFRI